MHRGIRKDNIRLLCRLRQPCPERRDVSRYSDYLPPADAADNGAAALPVSPLSLLISRHIFQEGEIIEFAIRPSPWWILFSSMHTLLLAAVVILASLTFSTQFPGPANLYLEVGVIIGMARIMWATVRWMSRLYVLTNLRVMVISGVFNVTIGECPLRRVGAVRLVSPMRERMLLLGSLEVIPMEEEFPFQQWQTIGKAKDIHRKIRAAVARARQHGST